MGWWAGGQQKDYDILFLLAIDVINYDKKTKLFIKGYNGQTSQTRNRKSYCDIYWNVANKNAYAGPHTAVAPSGHRRNPFSVILFLASSSSWP